MGSDTANHPPMRSTEPGGNTQPSDTPLSMRLIPTPESDCASEDGKRVDIAHIHADGDASVTGRVACLVFRGACKFAHLYVH